ncbi:MAG: tetratricopeptide repeat protein [Vampirovibrionales bacterium]|nr:tetratricopeptide repeat protein [Vampirovibrionales bacterium]
MSAIATPSRCAKRLALTGALLGLALISTSALGAEKQASSLLNQAAADFSQGKYSSAARHYRAALNENKTDPTVYLGLAMALKSDGRLPEAKGVLEQLIQLYPQYAPAHYNLGETLEAQGNLDAAKASYRRYLELSGGELPPSPEIRIKFRRLGLI